MPKLVWDKIVERIYETGLDHGVLYIPSAPRDYDFGVPWNGLKSIEEDFSTDVTRPHYFDGIKYLDSVQSGDYMAKMNAYTYPDEFLEFEGVEELGHGLFIDDQASKMFGLSYRSLIGSELDGTDHGYKLHLLYNLTAIGEPATYQNGSDLSEPVTFGWTIRGVPEVVQPYRPTSHIILDSRYLNSTLLSIIEDIIYGTNDSISILDGGTPFSSGAESVDGGDPDSAGGGNINGNVRSLISGTPPRLPSLAELIGLVVEWDPKLILPDLSGGLAGLISDLGDLAQTALDGIYSGLPETRLSETEVAGVNELLS